MKWSQVMLALWLATLRKKIKRKKLLRLKNGKLKLHHEKMLFKKLRSNVWKYFEDYKNCGQFWIWKKRVLLIRNCSKPKNKTKTNFIFSFLNARVLERLMECFQWALLRFDGVFCVFGGVLYEREWDGKEGRRR